MGAFGDAIRMAEGGSDEGLLSKEELIAGFVNPQLDRYSGCDRQVLEFIAQVRFHQWRKNEEAIESLFLTGYCYYFALMLKDAFGRGIVCNNGRSHIVWLDGTNVDTDIAYDICGVYVDYEVLIPVNAMGRGLDDFRWVPGITYGATEEEVNALVDKFMGVNDLSMYA